MPSILERYFNFIRKFLPEKAEDSSVGLDIGNSECKLVEVKKSGASFEILNWALEPIVNGDVKKAVGLVLGRLRNAKSIPYTSVFGRGTLIRYIDMPRMSLDDLRKSFSIESDKYFPFPQDQIYTDCYILNPQTKGPNMSVLVAAAKRTMVDPRIKLLNELELEAEYIGIDPIVLVNAFNTLKNPENKTDPGTTAIIDLGETVTNLMIVTNQVPQFTRDIFIGGMDMTRRVSSAFGINFPEAERLKIQPKEKNKEVLAACESIVINIVQEVKLSFDYFTTEKNGEINELILLGGGSMVEGILELFEKHLEIKASRWNPVAGLKVTAGIEQKEIEKNGCKLGVALGLAISQYD